MATFRWFNGNQGNFGYQDFGDYDITRITSNAIIAEYNGSDGPQDDARQPARIKVVIKDAVALNPGSSLSDRSERNQVRLHFPLPRGTLLQVLGMKE